ncbi:MAG: zinc ribbon domain-containing protein, partial [Mycobacteriales bacterium]
EDREAAEARLAVVAASEQEVRVRLAAATSERDLAMSEIDAEAAVTRSRRDELAPRIPPPLLALYERIRLDRGGVGAAPLVRHRCEGCHLELSGAELSAVRDAPADEVVR